MSKRLISVVIPSYNYLQFLPQAVASVTTQTYPEIELVLVDDCSADGSWEWIKSFVKDYAAKGSRVQALRNGKNEGAHHTINKGIAAASGEMVTVLNADDLYQPERFAVMTQHMGKARFAFSAINCIDENGDVLQTEQALAFRNIQKKIAGKRVVALSAVAENVAISTGNMLFEKSLFSELGGFRNYKYVHDYDFFLRMCLVTEPVFVPQTAYLYRLHGENSFTRLAKEGLRENRILWLEFYEEIKRGRVRNPDILQNPFYKDEFAQAVRAEGKKKETLWKLAGNPLVCGGRDLLKKRYGIK